MPFARPEIPAEDGAIDAFAAWPEGPGPHPPILLLSDSRGLTPAVERLARRLANEGLFVLAPDLFHRAHPRIVPGRPYALSGEPLFGPQAQREDFEAWLDWLAAERLVDDLRVGVLGYGVGGALGVRIAAQHAERIAAVASFYGRSPTGPAARDLAQRINAVLHLGYPADALWLHAAAIAEFEAALRAAGVDFETEAYPAAHGFAAEDHPAYDARAARLHWARLRDLFRHALSTARDAPRTADGRA
jgi:carboxymethylenebutenolidase